MMIPLMENDNNRSSPTFTPEPCRQIFPHPLPRLLHPFDPEYHPSPLSSTRALLCAPRPALCPPFHPEHFRTPRARVESFHRCFKNWPQRKSWRERVILEELGDLLAA